jgi:hypothetical protein
MPFESAFYKQPRFINQLAILGSKNEAFRTVGLLPSGPIMGLN